MENVEVVAVDITRETISATEAAIPNNLAEASTEPTTIMILEIAVATVQ